MSSLVTLTFAQGQKRNSRALLPILIYINCMSSDYVRLPEYAAARGEGLEHGNLEIRSR